jgi:hypothetical protein
MIQNFARGITQLKQSRILFFHTSEAHIVIQDQGSWNIWRGKTLRNSHPFEAIAGYDKWLSTGLKMRFRDQI